MSDILAELRQAIVTGEDDAALAGATAAMEQGLAPIDVLNQAIVVGIQEAGRLWAADQYFLPDVILSAGAFKAAMSVVEPRLAEGAGHKIGKVLIGVVAGDMHDLGKTLVIAMLSGAGFEVVDLGVNVPIPTLVAKARELKPDILGLGAYMSTTMLVMKEVIDGLKANGLRDKVKVMVGGVPTTQEFADQVGADAWGKDALDTVDKALRLMEVN